MRDCRGQLVRRSDHDAYHATYYGPPLPQTNEERFRAIVFCAAGYVPTEALDFRGDSPVKRRLSSEQMLRLQTSGELRTFQQKSVSDFLHDYVLRDPPFDHISIKLIDEFLQNQLETSDDRKQQQFLAHKLLSLVIDPSTEPLFPAYKQTLKGQLWCTDINSSPRDVVHDQIVGKGKRRLQTIRKIGALLHESLAVYRDMAAAA